MSDFLSFDGNPEFVAAFRFMFWSLFLGLSMVAWRYYRRAQEISSRGLESEWIPPSVPLGVCIVFAVIGTHQFYYWMVHRSNAQEANEMVIILGEIRHITSVLLVVGCVGGFLYAKLFLRDMFGPYWAVVGAAAMMCLWVIGYGDAKWL